MTRTQKMIVAATVVAAAQCLLPGPSYAQGRVGGNRGGGGGRGGADHGGGRVAVASPYYAPFYSPWFYDAWYGDPFAYGYPPGADVYGPTASMRLQVEPPQTEVFVDGYYAGPVDEFDGVFQRLRVDAGEHDIELYLQGYKSVRQKIYLQPDGTFRIRHTMQALAPGDAQEPRPIAAMPPPGEEAGAIDARRTAAPPAPGVAEPPQAGGPRDPRGRADSGFGAISMRVQPSDAEVLVDGERWDSSGVGTRLTIQLPGGSHRVEVRKPGFQPFSSVVPVRRGETATLNISLTKE